MHIESQCCTKDQAQTLYALGVFGDTLFYHTSLGILPRSSIDFKNGHVLNAFLGGELGHILSFFRYKCYGYPLIFTSSFNEDNDSVVEMFGAWSCGVRNPVDFANPNIKTSTEAQARAELLIFLLINKIVTAEHCNNALKQK